MKLLIRAVAGFITVTAMVAQAQFVCVTNSGAITITNYTGPGGNLAIPTTLGGLPVVSIAAETFLENSTLTSITIPEGVTSIGAEAFAGSSVLSNVSIASTVTNIGESAFGSCADLTTITVASLNPFFSSLGGILFNHNQSTLIQYPGGLAGNYVIPASVTSIGTNAFQNCWRMSDVTVPSGVVNIEPKAFEGCTGLTQITIPDGLVSIAPGSFANCLNLVNISIPASVTSIGFQAFAGCAMTGITIPAGVSSIGEQAFEGCPMLSTVAIPNSVTNVGQRAFALCGDLTSISVAAGNAFYSALGGVLFTQNRGALVQFPGGLVGSYTIPDGVTNIGPFAFAWCDQLASVTIPEGVTTIGDSAFYSCTSLNRITISASVTSIDDETNFGNTFYGCVNLTNVLFQGNAPPVSSSEFAGDNNATIYYLPGTIGWTSTFGGRPTVLLDPPTKAGLLRVTISPAAAITAGAKWRVDGGPWQTSGTTVSNLAIGSHLVDFNVTESWSPPKSFTVSIRSKSTTVAKGAYSFGAHGIYNGLFYSGNGVTKETAGMIKGLTVNAQGNYSGKLLIAGASHGFAGSFDPFGRATNHISIAATLGGPLTLEMALDLSVSPPIITGTVSGADWSASLTNDFALTTPNSAEYTMVAAAAGTPPGCGYLLITNHAGNATITGALADGTAFSQNAPVSSTGDLPIYSSLYNNTGLLLGWVNLSNTPPSGSVAWIKKSSHSVRYPDGFTNMLSVQGARWTTPPLHTAAIDLPHGLLEISGGSLPSPLDFNVALQTSNSLLKLPGGPTNSLTASVNPKTGLLTVKFADGVAPPAVIGKAAVLQNSKSAAGYFLSKTNAGSILLLP